MDSTRSVTAGDGILYAGSWLPEYSTRAERAIRLYEEHGHRIQHLYGDVYRVPSQDGERSYDVLYGRREECPCPDHQCRRVSCVHLLALGIAHAARRSGVKETRTVRVAAGDPFKAAAKRKGCPACFGGFVTIGVEEDGEEHDEAVPCRRCADSR